MFNDGTAETRRGKVSSPVLRPSGRVDSPWTTSMLSTAYPHSQASRPQGPQGGIQQLFKQIKNVHLTLPF